MRRVFQRSEVRPLPGWAVVVLRVAWVWAAVSTLVLPLVGFILLLLHVVLMPRSHRRQVLGERIDAYVTEMGERWRPRRPTTGA